MLIALYRFIMNIALPHIGAWAGALAEPVTIFAIVVAGIMMMLSAVGVKISNNLGSTIVNGIFRGIGYIFQTLFRAIGWVVRSTIQFLPRLFNGSQNTFIEWGLNPVLSSILAVLVCVAFVVIII